MLEEAGAFAIVLELVPREIAEIITNELTISTIGIGAGTECDIQVLVTARSCRIELSADFPALSVIMRISAKL